MGHPAALQPAPERRVLAGDLIGGHPGRRHPGLQGPLQQDPGQLGLVWNPTSSGTRAARQRARSLVHALGSYSSRSMNARPLELAYARTTPSWQLSTLPAVPEYWRWTPTEVVPFFKKPGLVHHQHPTRVAQVLHHLAAQVVTDQIRLPIGRGQQPLHPVRGGLAGMLGQLPTVLATHVADQPTQYASTRWRGSARTNRPAIRACTASSPAAHARTSSISAAASLASGTVPCLPGARRCRHHPAGGREPYRIKTSAAGVLGGSPARNRGSRRCGIGALSDVGAAAAQ